MGSDNKFWVCINVIFVVGICVIVISTQNYWKDHNAKIADMVSKGVNPVAVKCALQDDYGISPVCLVLAVK